MERIRHCCKDDETMRNMRTAHQRSQTRRTLIKDSTKTRRYTAEMGVSVSKDHFKLCIKERFPKAMSTLISTLSFKNTYFSPFCENSVSSWQCGLWKRGLSKTTHFLVMWCIHVTHSAKSTFPLAFATIYSCVTHSNNSFLTVVFWKNSVLRLDILPQCFKEPESK